MAGPPAPGAAHRAAANRGGAFWGKRSPSPRFFQLPSQAGAGTANPFENLPEFLQTPFHGARSRCERGGRERGEAPATRRGSALNSAAGRRRQPKSRLTTSPIALRRSSASSADFARLAEAGGLPGRSVDVDSSRPRALFIRVTVLGNDEAGELI